MAPLKQFVSDSHFFFFNPCKLEYNSCCVVAILNSFDFISSVFVQESIFTYFNLLPPIRVAKIVECVRMWSESHKICKA